MSKDYRVRPRSDRQIRGSAQALRRAFGVDNRHPVNVIRCLESGSISTDRGRKLLVYEVLDDTELDGDDGRTEYTADTVTIRIRRSVHDQAKFGEGRARMTLAHELGHAVMHPGGPKARRSGASGSINLSLVKPSESAEHQAKVFASAFLIDDAVAARLSGPEEIATEFLVSFAAAKICADRFAKETEHARSAERVDQATQLFKSTTSDQKQTLNFTAELCTTSGNPTLIPVRVKFLCVTCEAVSDQFQDGDRLDG